MEFVVSRDPSLSPRFLWPSPFSKDVPMPVKGGRTSYHFWARNALYHGLQTLGLQRGDKVLVPAFHCGTVIEPVLKFGCEVVFYNVNRDGGIDVDDLARRVDLHTKAIIAIHYFGTLQPVRLLQSFCRQQKLLFIEDCAHILMGEIDGSPIGSFGDISIFSWRKFFPIFDGGVLVRNQDSCHANVDLGRIDGWFQVKIVKNLLEKCANDCSSSVNLTQSLTSASQKTSCQHQDTQSTEVHETSLSAPVPEFDSSRVNWPMSSWSRTILKNVNIETVVEQRKANSAWLSDAIRSLSGVHSWCSDRQPNMCAWAFPVHVPNRKDVHVELRKRGVQAFSWGGVIHPMLQLEQFPDAQYLYEHLILLPNHQSLTRDEMTWMVEQLKDVLRTQRDSTEPVMQ